MKHRSPTRRADPANENLRPQRGPQQDSMDSGNDQSKGRTLSTSEQNSATQQNTESANRELRLQMERYETFIKNSSEGIWRIEFAEPVDILHDKDEIARQITERGVIAECNQALARMYGFQDPSELVGKYSHEFVADIEMTIASKTKFVEQNFSLTNVETVERDHLGNIHHFENSYIGEVHGAELVRMWGIQRDITEQRKLQEQLRVSESRYRNLVEQANDMVILLNERFEFEFVNKRFFELTRYTADEIWGKPFSILIPPEEAGNIIRGIQRQSDLQDQHLQYTIKILTKFNEERIVDFSMTTMYTEGTISGILAIGRDVTIEQTVKVALRESEEKYRSLVEHSLLGVLVIQNDVIIYANPTLSLLFEMELNSLIGTSLDSFVHPNDYLQLFEKFSEAALSPNKDVRFTIRVVTQSGNVKTLEGWAAGITYLGRPAIQAALVDVTETRRLEEQLIQSQKMESVGQLASGVAHDFNNLLGSIYGAIEILRKKFVNSDHGLKKYLDVLDASAKRAAELTSQLLTFSRQHGSNIKPVRLNDIVNDSMKILTRSIGKNIKIESALDPTLHTIEADPSQIESVIINLSINSRDAMPHGGTLRLETSNVEFTQQVLKQFPEAHLGRYACLAVSDTGIGMSPETRRKIFEPFFTTKPLGKGTGLGLSIVYGVVKNHRGLIKVYSEPGRGTTFRIYFPASDKIPLDELVTASQEILHGTETVLIIDDEMTLLDLTEEILEGLGYKVITANGALAGIEAFKQCWADIDLVILDMLMPEMTGAEVYPILKNIKPELSVLLATGLNVGERIEDLISMGVNDVVGKPYSVSDLALHVRKAIDNR